MHHFSTIDTQQGIYRTHLNQYQSIAAPRVAWLKERGVSLRFGVTVTSLEIKQQAAGGFVVEGLSVDTEGASQEISINEKDCVFVTNGSMTLARDRPQFGNSAAWRDEAASRRSRIRTGCSPCRCFTSHFWPANRRVSGSGGAMDCISTSLGTSLKKIMGECNGKEILEEVVGHLRFDSDREAIIGASNVIPCVMPYITSQFSARKAGDRPHVVPKGSKNLAFIGQFCEHPDDVVLTVDYSIRSAQRAVYTLLALDKELTPMYKGAHDPRVLFEALATVGR